MTYLRVWYLNGDPDDPGQPALSFHEPDEARWEVRKVEIFGDGRIGYADATVEWQGTGLSERAIPSFEEIAAQRAFEPTEISKEEFEVAWAGRYGTKD